MPRSPIIDSIKRVNEAIAYLQNTLNPGEIDLLLDELAPLPEPEPEVKPAKKLRKKSSKSASKSARASSLQQQLKATASRTITGPACGVCGNVEDHPDHDTAHYLSAHEFDAGKSPASTAQPARGRSSTNGASSATGSGTRRTAQPSTGESDERESQNASSSTLGIETDSDAVGVAVGGSSE